MNCTTIIQNNLWTQMNLKNRPEFLIAVAIGLVLTYIIFKKDKKDHKRTMEKIKNYIKENSIYFFIFYVVSGAIWLLLMIFFIPEHFNIPAAAQIIFAFFASIWVMVQVYYRIFENDNKIARQPIRALHKK